ncbi:Spo0E family sporulation regulatory protein-aspartic acid phosphatase [Halanaerobaculum tunisiense]
MNKEKLLIRIEDLRKELHELTENGEVKEEVLEKSQQLDKLLNKYYKLIMDN